MTRPSGFIMSEATLASSQVGAMPIELRRRGPTSRLIRALMARASFSAAARVGTKSCSWQVTSSIDWTTVSGVQARITSTSRRW